jgi:hypothetical protein
MNPFARIGLPIAYPGSLDRHRANPGLDWPFRPVSVAHNPLSAQIILYFFMRLST